jgi:hypothetical protein
VHGIIIQARTSMPGWTGEPLDVRYAISVLHPLAAAPREPISLPPSRLQSERLDPVFSDRRVFSKGFVTSCLGDSWGSAHE